MLWTMCLWGSDARVLLRIHAFVAKWVSLQIHAFLGLFGADFYADIKDLTQILCIYLDLKSAAGISDILVELNLVFVKSTTYWAGRAVYPTQVTWKAKFKCYAIILHLDRSITGDPQTSTGEDNEVTGDGLLGKGAQKRKMEIFHDLRIRVAPPSFYWHFFPSIFFTP